MTMSSLY